MHAWYKTIWANESGGSDFTESATVDIPSTDVLVMCFLQQVSGYSARVAITSYVEKGDPYSGSWQIMNGNDVTSVTFALTVNNCTAQAVGLILAINE